ncbi:recombinase family protein [Pseudoalteromonas rhizosphaerae]|uniref:recombinase family protein n=1 Tax=Pseudoalteromonas rhizosphaerae TaxID=2518973 RepID=UPI00237F6777|nr:recombinase family protein [Pseudoalteromonas rhizosphaerae]
MSRLFSYTRVSTTDQTTNNQDLSIKNAGFKIESNRAISEIISGSVQAMKRPKFAKLIDRLELNDTLVVSKLDRLGRDNIDVQQTISMLQNMGVRVISLDLPSSDLTTSEGKLILQMFAVFAEFERNRIRERTKEGLARAKAKGVTLGRKKVSQELIVKIQELKAQSFSQSKVVEALKGTEFQTSIATVKRNWK